MAASGGEGRVRLDIRVTPNADRDAVIGLWRGPKGEARLALRVTAPPDKGRANKAVIALLAALLGLPKSALSITAGDKDRLKTVVIAGAGADIARKIAALAPDKEKTA
ncbi:MAG: DUF167 family protein [Amphiplicatus sp.]